MDRVAIVQGYGKGSWRKESGSVEGVLLADGALGLVREPFVDAASMVDV